MSYVCSIEKANNSCTTIKSKRESDASLLNALSSSLLKWCRKPIGAILAAALGPPQEVSAYCGAPTLISFQAILHMPYEEFFKSFHSHL